MKNALVLMLAMTFLGCAPDFFETVRRDNTPPVNTKPSVECYVRENCITVFWDEDQAADEYYLFRKASAAGDFTNVVYTGKAVSFVDTDVDNGSYYYYKLQKRRSTKLFPKSDPVLGVAHVVGRDEYEDNNTKERATPFYVFNGVEANIATAPA